MYGPQLQTVVSDLCLNIATWGRALETYYNLLLIGVMIDIVALFNNCTILTI